MAIFVLVFGLLLAFKAPEKTGWNEASKIRKSAYYLALPAMCIFWAFHLKYIEFRLSQSLVIGSFVAVLVELLSAIVIIEFLRFGVPSGKEWSSRKHTMFLFSFWALFFAFDSLGTLIGKGVL